MIERELGRGGMGAVYLARHTTLDVPVAVKVMPHHLAKANPEFAERFLREARLAARLRHPNVMGVMDADRDAETGLYYIVQEYVPGGSMRDRLAAGPLPEADAVKAVKGIANALVAAADQGILHRDIKPDNILIGDDGRVRLADLGLAKQVETDGSHLTASSTALGTPSYMSPEQIQDAKNVDVRSDIYSLGATLYHLLTGQPPFSGENVFNIMHQVVNSPTPDPRELRPDLTEGVASVCLRMLSKEPERRYQTAGDLLAALRQAGAGASSAPPGSEMEIAPTVVDPHRGPSTPPPPAPPGTGEQQQTLLVGGGIAIAVLALVVLIVLLTRPSDDGPEPERRETAAKEADDPPAFTETDPTTEAAPATEEDPAKEDPAKEDPAEEDPPPVKDPLPPDTQRPSWTRGAVLAHSFEDDTQTGRRFRDLTGNGNDITVGPGVTVEASKRPNTTREEYLRFDGSGVLTGLPAPGACTVSMWFEIRGDGTQVILDMGTANEQLQGFHLGVYQRGEWRWWNTATGGVYLGLWEVEVLVPSARIRTGWHHLVLAWDGATSVRVAIDGVFPGGAVVRAGGSADQPRLLRQPFAIPALRLGRNRTTVLGGLRVGHARLGRFTGDLDELVIWNRALTKAEILTLWGTTRKNRLSYSGVIGKEESGRGLVLRGKYLYDKHGFPDPERKRLAQAAFLKGSDLWRAGEKKRSRESYGEAYRLYVVGTTIGHNKRGIAALEKGEYDAAIAHFEKAMALRPDYPAWYYNRGLTLYQKEDFAAALADFSRAIELGQVDAAIFVVRGSVYRALSKHLEEFEDYQRAVRLDPDNWRARYGLARALHQRGRKDDAIKMARAALKLAPPEHRKTVEALIQQLGG